MKVVWLFLLFLFLLLGGCGRPTAKATEELPFLTQWENFGIRDGLPGGKVFAVAVDGNKIWAGTEEGLALYENGKFRIWNRSNGLVHDVVLSLAVDRRRGGIWIGTLGGLSYFNGREFRNYTEKNSKLSSNLVFGVGLQGPHVWCATFVGASRLTPEENEWKVWNDLNAPFHEVWCYGLSCKEDKVYYAIWGAGLMEWDVAMERWKDYVDPDRQMEIDLFRNDGLIHDILVTTSYENGVVWCGTYMGLSRYDGKNWKSWVDADGGLPSNFINFVKSPGRGCWMCMDKGLSYYDDVKDTWVNYLPTGDGNWKVQVVREKGVEKNFQLPIHPSDGFVWGIDFQGEDVWMGTSKGLSHGSRGKAVLSSLPAEPAPPSGKPPKYLSTKLPRKPYHQAYRGFGKPHYVFYEKPQEYLGPGREIPEPDVKEVKIGVISNLKGAGSAYGKSMQRGIELAVRELNATGGYRGKPFVLLNRPEVDMKVTGNSSVDLICGEKVWAMIGCTNSGNTHVLLRVALKEECPAITSIATDPTICMTGSPWMFRCLVDDIEQGRALATLLFEKKHFKRIAILEHNNKYGRMGVGKIRNYARRLGHPPIIDLKFDSKQEDFSTHVARIREANPDAIVIWGLYMETALLTREFRDGGVAAPIFGADGMVSPEYIQMAGPAAEGVVVTYPYDPNRPDPVNRAFIQHYERVYGAEPNQPDSFVAHGYDAMMLVGRAVRRGGLNRARIRDVLFATKNFPGATGRITFDLTGNDTRPVFFAVIRNGRFVPLTRQE